jgi:hypothetical protein
MILQNKKLTFYSNIRIGVEIGIGTCFNLVCIGHIVEYVGEFYKLMDIKRTDEEMKYLEEPYAHNQYGFR